VRLSLSGVILGWPPLPFLLVGWGGYVWFGAHPGVAFCSVEELKGTRNYQSPLSDFFYPNPLPGTIEISLVLLFFICTFLLI